MRKKTGILITVCVSRVVSAISPPCKWSPMLDCHLYSGNYARSLHDTHTSLCPIFAETMTMILHVTTALKILPFHPRLHITARYMHSCKLVLCTCLRACKQVGWWYFFFLIPGRNCSLALKGPCKPQFRAQCAKLVKRPDF